MNRKGIALILSFAVIGILLVLGSAMLSRSISERVIAQRYMESTQAFWLAEAGINRALDELRNIYNSTGILWTTNLGQGAYYVDVQPNGLARTVTAYGYIPSSGTPRVQRIITTTMNKNIPPNFYNNAIYSGNEVDFNGNNYGVTGDVRYADEIDYSQNRVTGTIYPRDPSMSPLARLDFQQLLTLSQGQDNVYIEQNNKLVKESTGLQGLPSSFWYSPGVPNVVYIKSDLELNGNIAIGGFLVVVGDVITNPTGTYDASMNGTGAVDGVIYTRGEFEINGGGAAGLNVNGGVWAGQEAELNGTASISYNSSYMGAIQNLGIDAAVQITSWRDTQNPYYLQ